MILTSCQKWIHVFILFQVLPSATAPAYRGYNILKRPFPLRSFVALMISRAKIVGAPCFESFAWTLIRPAFPSSWLRSEFSQPGDASWNHNSQWWWWWQRWAWWLWWQWWWQVHDMTTDELLEAFPVTEITPQGDEVPFSCHLNITIKLW